MTKKTNHLLHLLGMVLFALCLVMAAACDKCEDPTNMECENYDPCWEVTETNAAFIIREMYNGSPDQLHDSLKSSITDTVTNGTYVRFTALHEASSYTWWIGNEAEPRTGKDITVRFDDNHNGATIGTISIKLHVEKEPNNLCYPNDDGQDSSVQSLTIVHPDSAPTVGRYSGYLLNNPDEIYTVEIIWTTYGLYKEIRKLVNLRNIGNEDGGWVTQRYKGFSAWPFTTLGVPTAYFIFGFLSEDNQEIKITYREDTSGDHYVERTFLGKRIY